MGKKSLFVREFELEIDERMARHYHQHLRLLLTKIKLRAVRKAISKQFKKERGKKNGSKIR
ncbi:MAG: hypothetical protein EOL95_10345 [Bacteroidia bacterium]|nr:hypothetical protein [Bacteroidia bacterium]